MLRANQVAWGVGMPAFDGLLYPSRQPQALSSSQGVKKPRGAWDRPSRASTAPASRCGSLSINQPLGRAAEATPVRSTQG